MDDVTDTVFREIVAKHAPADLMMTEFANADGYCSPGKHAIMSRLKYNPIEGPVVAQIWGIDPKNYYTMAKDMKGMGFVGVDINMGCPVKDMIKKGQTAVDDIMGIARQSDHPRAFEVTGQLIKTVAETAKDLLALQKQKKDLIRPEAGEAPKQIGTQNNIVFSGSTNDLLKMLKNQNEKVIDADPTKTQE